MKLRNISTTLLILVTLGLAGPAFAEKIGVTFQGDQALENAISASLKGDGHEIVDISSAARGARLDSVAAASIGKSTGAQIIVSGKKLGSVIVIKVLSTKNDTVAGGTCPAGNNGAAADTVKKILSDNKAKMTR
ncbi:MAG: hypothetical protein P1V20_02000 [Verrucomicrobiales bacterium]|nr:hypothetical protein [Verrucomicrobiales bacterium]